MTTELDKAYESMGTKNELIYKPIIENLYGKVIKTSYKYSRVDFLGENYCGELKSRNLSINDFKDTMIGYNKIQNAFKTLEWFKEDRPNYKVYFWFAFKEGLYCWEFNKDNYELNGGDTKIKYGGTCNRGIDDYKDHYYINNNLLVKINNTPVWIHSKVKENTKYNKPTGICLLKFKK